MSKALFTRLAEDVHRWRNKGYICEEYPLVGEILAYQKEEDNLTLKFLREPQLLALEVYWYVRLVLKTPHIIDIYKDYYGKDKRAFFDVLGVPLSQDYLEDAKIDLVIKKIRENKDFVKRKRIEALHEAITLDYPSYILALAMGAGKTVLIGAIIATEFAMSLRYPDSKDNKFRFMKNALVFAPGTTIIESLRELSDMPFDKILPPALSRDFHANLKIEFPGKSKDIQAQRFSSYNLIVTNTEKISLRANKTRSKNQEAFKRDEVQANSRLQTIASLPNLGIFSDEAHHTYGNTFDKLKRVRQTIDYIHNEKPIVAVINTTGTPYYRKQPLKEVIIWYGLGEGIKDNILKDLNEGIHQYDIGSQPEAEVFDHIIQTFFDTYGNVSLPNGAKAKIAFYFKTQEHLDHSRQLIEHALTKLNESPSQILVNTQKSSSANIDEFKRLNNPGNQKRVILLIAKGVEGWNCPSLFACALIKEQTSSNNYVLQAATRCLRQVPGNLHSAKIFLDDNNAKVLDKELQDNFGTDLDRICIDNREKEPVTLRILKYDLPKLEINYTIKKAIRTSRPDKKINLQKPKVQEIPSILLNILTPDFSGPREILMPTGETKELPLSEKSVNCYTAAWKIATRYHLSILPILKKLKQLYPQGEIPNHHLYDLFLQVERQQANYKEIEEQVSEVMALIKVKDEKGEDIFEQDENGTYVHELRVIKSTLDRMQADGLLAHDSQYTDERNLSFHYTPYNFDSTPERSFFQKILNILKTNSRDVEAFLFTGGLTDPAKTDFHFEYRGEDKRYHRYFPDFVIVKKTGEFYIVEVKAKKDRDNRTVKAKEKALRKLEAMQRNQFKYHVVYTSGNNRNVNEIGPIQNWIKN